MFKNLLKLSKFTQPALNSARVLKTAQKNTLAHRNYAQEAAAEEEKETKPNHVNPFSSAPKEKTAQQEDELPNSNNEDEVRRLKVLQLELDMANQEAKRVPTLEFMQAKYWDHVLTLRSKSARYKYYQYLWQIEKKQESKGRRKEERAVYAVERKEELRKARESCDHIIYGLGHTSLFLRIYDSTVNLWQNNRLSRAMQFAPKVVMDCAYDQYMTNREATNASKQLMISFAENRMHDDPLDLHYCNVDLSSVCMQSLKRYIPTMLDPEFPMNVHEKCFTELFPKENLVYLTPHCRTDLTEYNPDDVYIIGAIVDTVNNEPLSLARAKRMGLRMARLPLDQYLQWGAGSGKSLTLNQMMKILLDLRRTGDWMTSLRHVPRRKVLDEEAQVWHDKKGMHHRAKKLNVRFDKLFEFENERKAHRRENSVTVNMDWNSKPERKVREHKHNLQFNLDTWASKKPK